jgi:hypothetical protein
VPGGGVVLHNPYDSVSYHAWVQIVQSVAVPALCKQVYEGIVKVTTDFEKTVISSIPNYEDIISDTTLDKELGKQMFVPWAQQARLTHCVGVLVKAVGSLVRVKEKFEVECSVEDEEKVAQFITSFRKAKIFLVVTVALRIITSPITEALKAEAHNLILRRKEVLPKTLLAELENVKVGKASASGVSTFTVKKFVK